MDDDVDSTAFDQSSVDNAWNEAMATRAGARSIAAVLGGKTFTPGTMRSSTFSMAAATTVTLNGGPDDIFLFQTAGSMGMGANCKIALEGGAQAKNVLWAIGTTFTSGATTSIEGSITAGGAVTIAAGNTVAGSVVSKGAITFGADVPIDGCVIPVGALTFGTGCSVVAPQPVTSAPTISPTVTATSEPTASPTVAATAEPTASPTDTPVALADSTSATVAFADLTPAPYCGSDVLLVRKIGSTSYNDKPITIISQSSPTGEVTFQISQEWTNTDISYLFVRFRDEELAYPNCHTFEHVNATWKSGQLTAFCNKFSNIALVEIWASDASFMVSDVAVLPECSCNAPTTNLPMVKYIFQMECVSTCPGPACPSSTGRMLGSVLGTEF